MTDSNADAESTDDQLRIRRTFDAPREWVWRAFTDADELEEWFVPEGMTAEVTANEVEPGGEMAIHWTDGENRIQNEGYYVAVDENERLVSGEKTEDGELRVTYEFRDVEDGTEVVVTQEFPAGVPDDAAQGWAAMLDALDDLLEARATDTDFAPGEFDVTIERTFEAPREVVWEAWTDPEQVAEWWGPTHFTVPHCELDVRPGGELRIDMEGPDGTLYPSEGVFEAVNEPERLVLVTAAGENDDGNYQFQVRQTVTFEEQDGETAITLEAEVLEATPDATEHLEGMEEGWSQSFEKLETFLRHAQLR